MAAKKFQMTKRKAVAVVAATAVFAVVSASAATLGGVDADAFGADQGVIVAPLENGVTLSWDTAYSAEAGQYVLDAIAVNATDANENISTDAEVRVTITNAAGNEMVEYVSENGGTTWEAYPIANVVLAQHVAGAAVVINGSDVTVNPAD